LLSLTLKREVARVWPKSKSKNLLFMFEVLAKFCSLDVNIYGWWAKREGKLHGFPQTVLSRRRRRGKKARSCVIKNALVG
jgi:hypothetical protein